MPWTRPFDGKREHEPSPLSRQGSGLTCGQFVCYSFPSNETLLAENKA
jgi:hypothetical protein